MRPEVQVLPGPQPALTSGNAGSSPPYPIGRGESRIKNSYLVTRPCHVRGGSEAYLFEGICFKSRRPSESSPCSCGRAAYPVPWGRDDVPGRRQKLAGLAGAEPTRPSKQGNRRPSPLVHPLGGHLPRRVLVTIQETGERFGIVTRVARQLSIATESLRAQGREEDVVAAASSGVPYTSFDAEDDRLRSWS